jgi:hypothetical protein
MLKYVRNIIKKQYYFSRVVHPDAVLSTRSSAYSRKQDQKKKLHEGMGAHTYKNQHKVIQEKTPTAIIIRKKNII